MKALSTTGGVVMNKLTLTIFGGTGDLTYRKLLPAMYNLYIKNQLPKEFLITPIGRRDYTDTDYQGVIEPWISEFAQVKVKDEQLQAFFEHIHYFPWILQLNHNISY